MRFYVKPRHKYIYGQMNGLEKSYSQNLNILKNTGTIVDWKFEKIKLKLAGDTFYTPDFFVVKPERIEFHEVKGFWRDDARVKIKVAAEQYPWFLFVAITLNRKTKCWEEEFFNT